MSRIYVVHDAHGERQLDEQALPLSIGGKAAGDIIMPARCRAYRTQAGRFTNHSKHPNAEMVKSGEDITLVALIAINRGDEITIDYRCVINLQITERNEQCQV